MKIEVRKNGVPVAIVTFHTHMNRFESDYERSKFFRDLHGWKQTVPKNGKRYLYHRKGLLDEVPHVKVADSAFIVALDHMQRVMRYFDEWANKVEYDMMKMITQDREMIKKLMEQGSEEG